jgi:hypothetical protein
MFSVLLEDLRNNIIINLFPDLENIIRTLRVILVFIVVIYIKKNLILGFSLNLRLFPGLFSKIKMSDLV